jgi:hypothetical protein
MKIIFAPGSFDAFDGTQEELDELMNEIQELVESGDIFENSYQVDLDQMQEEDPELFEILSQQLEKAKDLEDGVHFISDNRKLN